MLILLTAIIALFLYAQSRLRSEVLSEPSYQYHYMFIGKTEDSYTSNYIYDEAKKYGDEHGAYVERLGEFLNANYTYTDYLKMAIAMKVDGIILEGVADDETGEYINEAYDAGIPTITLMSDCPGSKRKSFIEIGDYNLGREYGRIVIKITKTRTPKVMLLEDKQISSERDDVLKGFQDTLRNEGNHLDVDLVTEKLNGTANFRIIDEVKSILADEEKRPDILICMNERDTQMVYQAIKDYDLTNTVQIVGSSISESLLKAVRDGEFAALVDANAKQAGMVCVDALNNYMKTADIDQHIIIEDTVITNQNVERYLQDE